MTKIQNRDIIYYVIKSKGDIVLRYFKSTNNLKFAKMPESFDKNTPKDILKYAIGANMYMPGYQDNIYDKLVDNVYSNLGSMTLCCEDACAESRVEEAEDNIRSLLKKISYISKTNPKVYNTLPLVFVRVRNVDQFKRLAEKLDQDCFEILAGVNFPKFTSSNGREYYGILKMLSEKYNTKLYGMPILESKEVIFKETRFEELKKIQDILSEYSDYVLNIRVGGTDFSSLFGLKRSMKYTIYDLKVVSDCLIDIINFFLRQDFGYVVSGPVWEFISWDEESVEVQGLKKELELDIENGFHGKTVIHPSQIDFVNREYVVKESEYNDAVKIIQNGTGVFKGSNNNMCECGPHANWAKKIVAKAKIYGVLDSDAQLNIA